MNGDDERNSFQMRLDKSQLYIPVRESMWPIVYSSHYNISFLGLQKLHPFDSGKWGKIYLFLKEAGMIQDDTTVCPLEATEDDLLVVHSKNYLNSLRWSINVAAITEIPPVALLPNFIVQRRVLRPFRYHTGGTILAGKLAVDRGWAINLGGGFHHCSADRGGGFCAYADITLALKFLFEKVESIANAMVIDLDAHQGNGYQRDIINTRLKNIYVMDVYNRGIYPFDGFAKNAIQRKVELEHFTEDEEYLRLVSRHIEGALNEFTPDIVVYNAGTDILKGDPLGHLCISPQGIIERDRIVFENVKARGIPLFMLTSGGYVKSTARVIADSILNLHQLGLIHGPEVDVVQPLFTDKPLTRSRSDGGIFTKVKRSCFSKSSTFEFETQTDQANQQADER